MQVAYDEINRGIPTINQGIGSGEPAMVARGRIGSSRLPLPSSLEPMYLQKIAIKNFRSIEALEVELGPGLNVLVGENNVGKTTVLDALRAGLGAAAAGGDAIRLSSEDRHRGSDGKHVADPIEVDVYFAGLSSDEQAEFIDALNYVPAAPERSTASVHFRWSYAEDTKRHHVKRWGGERGEAETPIPEDTLQSVPLTLLGALRDAVTALAPGRQSRVARLLDVSAEDGDREKVVEITETANASLVKTDLVRNATKSIRRSLQGASGKNYAQNAIIQTSEPEFERIVSNLQLVLRLVGLKDEKGKPRVLGLRSNGLGYNNLLYIGTVMAELEATPIAQASLPMLLVEEPEAHLHPQLQTLLATFLGEAKAEDGASSRIQTIVTTHSPTIASHVPITTIRVLHRAPDGKLRCIPLGSCGLDARESSQLRRMFDVTRATLLFARGVILVEGVAELLLIPVLAKRLGISLEERGVTVIQVCGVDFKTIAKLFGPGKLEVPVSIVTDGDPGKIYPATMSKDEKKKWKFATPAVDPTGTIKVCDRTQGLKTTFAKNPHIRVFTSKVTLEHALSEASELNPKVMCDAWRACYTDEPETFNQAILDQCGDNHADQVLAVWRGICLANPSVTKGQYAQALADELTPTFGATPEALAGTFVVPSYLEEAILYAIGPDAVVPGDELDDDEAVGSTDEQLFEVTLR